MSQPINEHYDVLVYDATPGGIAAAISASRQNCSVLLLTEDKHVGGLQTSGLGNTNAGNRATVGGIAREFHQRILDYYIKKYGPNSQQVIDCQNGFFFEPHVALEVYRAWLEEAGVTCLYEDYPVQVSRDGTKLTTVETQRGRRISASVFIDASYEGDLLQLAGCTYHLGREASATYSESLAGVRYPPEQLGQADHKLQAFDYRLCLTDNPDNQVPIWKPASYDFGNYAYYAACLYHEPPTALRNVLPLNMMPNRKTDSRTGEWVGASWAYPEASREERKRIEQQHRDYSAGYLWFLLTDKSVPRHVQEEMQRWGYARDEFADNDHWPYHIYVREARRLVGDFVMTQQDVTEDRFKPDAVALGSFFLDVHPVQMVLIRTFGGIGGTSLVPEGELGYPRDLQVKPYEIAYRTLLPKLDEAQNLLVPVCLSASHIAFSTIRMEPVWMMLGHAAGLAAVLSLQNDVRLHELDSNALQQQLVEQGQIIDARMFP